MVDDLVPLGHRSSASVKVPVCSKKSSVRFDRFQTLIEMKSTA